MTNDSASTSGWRAFWERGGWWKAVLVAAVYMALYLGVGWLIGRLWGSAITEGGPLGSAVNVLLFLVLPIGIGAVIIVAFLVLSGLVRRVFAAQPVRGRWWMWIAVAVVAYPIVLRLIGIDYGSFAPGVVPLTLLAGVFIGVAEELVTRGAAVTLLRNAGHSELVVAVLSSTIFALMHTANAIGTGFTPAVLITIPYTFCFGMCMYLVMRATGSIVWAIVAHALTDPTLFLSTGGIDTAATGHQNGFLIVASTGNWTVILMGIVALFLVRGRADYGVTASRSSTAMITGAFATPPDK
ncbi:hypothetical protein GCM10027406_27280 [Leifsonia lichenia]